MRVSSMTEELKGEALSESLPSSIQKKMEMTDGRSKEKGRRSNKGDNSIQGSLGVSGDTGNGSTNKGDNSLQGNIGVSGDTGNGSSNMAEGWFFSGEANNSAVGSGTMGDAQTQHGC